MNAFESRVIAYVCLVFGATFGYLDAPWVSLLFFSGALGLLFWAIYKDHIEGGGGPGPLKPA